MAQKDLQQPSHNLLLLVVQKVVVVPEMTEILRLR